MNIIFYRFFFFEVLFFIDVYVDFILKKVQLFTSYEANLWLGTYMHNAYLN